MGWLSWPSQPSQPTPTSDGAYIAPDRSKREKCYEARDTFFACLEQHGIVDSVKDEEHKLAAAKVCGNEEKGMAKECAASWVRDTLILQTR